LRGESQQKRREEKGDYRREEGGGAGKMCETVEGDHRRPGGVEKAFMRGPINKS